MPQTVSPGRLQQANALQGLSRNLTGILGPAIGGALVVAGSPGSALGIDALSFFVCAAILYRIKIAPRASTDEREGFVHELRAGWKEFTSRTWLWASVILFGIGNLGFCAWIILGPVIAKEDLGGAGAWGTIVAVERRRRRCRQPDRAARAPEAAARRVHALGDTAGGPGARPRPGAVRVAALDRFVLRRRRDRGAPDALVHALPARDPRADAVARQLLRRPRLVRADADRLRDRRPAVGCDRRHRDAVALVRRDADDLGADPVAALRVGAQGPGGRSTRPPLH